jgi:chromosome segregation ATPase
MEAELATVRSSLASVTAEAATLRKDVDTHTQAAAKARKAVEAENARLDLLSRDILQPLATRLGVEPAKVRLWVAEVRSRRSGLQERLRQLSLSIETLKQQLELDAAAQPKVELEAVQVQMATIKADAAKTAKMASEVEKRLSGLRLDLEKAEKSVAAAAKVRADAELKHIEAGEQLRRARQRVRGLLDAVAMATVRVGSAKELWDEEVAGALTSGTRILVIRKSGASKKFRGKAKKEEEDEDGKVELQTLLQVRYLLSQTFF